MLGRQAQRAGENSQQVQATGTVIIHNGPSPEQVQVIMDQTAALVRREFVAEAHVVINERIAELGNRVMAELELRGRFDAFTDPAFLRAFKSAQDGAAATARSADYDTLSALLAKRTETPHERKMTSAIDRAIEIVDQIDDEALRGLTVVWALSSYRPTTGMIRPGLDAMEEVALQLVDGPLPEGNDWLDHLDILDALRVSGTRGVQTFPAYFGQLLPGYVAKGVPTEEVPESVSDKLPGVPWAPFLVEHELKPGFQGVAKVTEDQWRTELEASGLDADLIPPLLAAAKRTMGFGRHDAVAVKALALELEKRPTLHAISEWWNAFYSGFQFTGIGRMLAEANAHRLDPTGKLPRTEEDEGSEQATEVDG